MDEGSVFGEVEAQTAARNGPYGRGQEHRVEVARNDKEREIERGAQRGYQGDPPHDVDAAEHIIVDVMEILLSVHHHGEPVLDDQDMAKQPDIDRVEHQIQRDDHRIELVIEMDLHRKQAQKRKAEGGEFGDDLARPQNDDLLRSKVRRQETVKIEERLPNRQQPDGVRHAPIQQRPL